MRDRRPPPSLPEAFLAHGHLSLSRQSWARGAHEDRPQAAETPSDPEGADVQGALAVQ